MVVCRLSRVHPGNTTEVNEINNYKRGHVSRTGRGSRRKRTEVKKEEVRRGVDFRNELK